MILLDRNLEAIERIHMFEAGRDGFMQISRYPVAASGSASADAASGITTASRAWAPAKPKPVKKVPEKKAAKGAKAAAEPAETKKRR